MEWHTQGSVGFIEHLWTRYCCGYAVRCSSCLPCVGRCNQCSWSVASSVLLVCMACALGVLYWDSLNNSPRYCGGGDIRKAIKDTFLIVYRVLRWPNTASGHDLPDGWQTNGLADATLVKTRKSNIFLWGKSKGGCVFFRRVQGQVGFSMFWDFWKLHTEADHDLVCAALPCFAAWHSAFVKIQDVCAVGAVSACCCTIEGSRFKVHPLGEDPSSWPENFQYFPHRRCFPNQKPQCLQLLFMDLVSWCFMIFHAWIVVFLTLQMARRSNWVTLVSPESSKELRRQVQCGSLLRCKIQVPFSPGSRHDCGHVQTWAHVCWDVKEMIHSRPRDL